LGYFRNFVTLESTGSFIINSLFVCRSQSFIRYSTQSKQLLLQSKSYIIAVSCYCRYIVTVHTRKHSSR